MGYGSLGAQEILGAMEILGRADPDDVQEALSGNPHLAAKIAHARAAGGVYVKEDHLDKRRRLIMGIAPTSVTTLAVADIETKPQQLMRIERVVVPSDIAFFFGIEDVKVGNRSQLVASGQLPAATFTEVARDCYVHWDTAVVGNIVTISVINNDTVTHVFRGTLLGTAAIS